MADTVTDDGAQPASAAGAGERPGRRPFALYVVAILAIASGALLVVLLFFQHLEVYLTFFGEVAVAEPEHGTRYVVTALTCLALLVVGTVCAIATGRRGLTWTGAVLLVVGVAVAMLFAVPNDRWERQPEPRPANTGPVCYSGSDCSEFGG